MEALELAMADKEEKLERLRGEREARREERRRVEEEKRGREQEL